MTLASAPYPIGTPGIAWGETERAQWLARQVRQRSYAADVVSAIERLAARFHRIDLPGGCIGWAVHRNDIVRTVAQPVEHLFGKGGLTDQDDAHGA